MLDSDRVRAGRGLRLDVLMVQAAGHLRSHGTQLDCYIHTAFCCDRTSRGMPKRHDSLRRVPTYILPQSPYGNGRGTVQRLNGGLGLVEEDTVSNRLDSRCL